MSYKHSNISIFVPHIGCPNKCSFCNQRHITGSFKAPHPSDVIKAVETAALSKNYNPETTEIAFFGGSFTAINRGYMQSLLETASEFVKKGIVSGIRISTRPDAIDDEILTLLKDNNVTAIELGAQSLNDRVLRLNNRGHKTSDVYNASTMIKEYGFELGLQIMTGLYCDSDQSAIKTAKKVIEIAPDTVRIYPTIVLKDTDLAALYADGIYKPQTLDEAINLAVKLYNMFTESGINVIRLGLHSIENDAYIAGPWHPAFSELCQSQIMLNSVLKVLSEKGKYNIYVGKSDVSKMIGQKRSNLVFLESKGYHCKVKEKASLGSLKFELEKEKD